MQEGCQDPSRAHHQPCTEQPCLGCGAMTVLAFPYQKQGREKQEETLSRHWQSAEQGSLILGHVVHTHWEISMESLQRQEH